MLIKEGKTNIKYLLIVVILAAVVVGGTLWCVTKQEVPTTQPIQLPEVKELEKTAEDETEELTLEALKNAEYYSSWSDTRIKLTNGSYFYTESPPDPKWTIGLGAYTEIFNDFKEEGGEKVAFGDLNDNGREDAAVILGTSGGGSGYFYELAIMINQDGTPYHLTYKYLGDRVRIKSITIESGEIVLDMVVHGPEEGLCCPSVEKIFKYKISESQLIEVKEDETADWKIYRNERYGFELTFPERWKGYKVKEEREGIEFSLQRSEDKEYRPVFGIMVSPKEIWEQYQSKESSNVGTYIAEKGNNVLSYYLWKTYGDEGYIGFPEVIADEIYQGPFFDVQTKIIPTFKLTDLGVCEYRKGDYEMRIYDSQGRITGSINGEIKEEIPNSVYDEESGQVLIFDSQKSYIYELFCIKEGNYQFGETFVEGGEVVTFNAINIPFSPGETHRYKLDWDALLREEDGATLMIDADGDGVFEKTITSDTELACEEFLSQTR